MDDDVSKVKEATDLVQFFNEYTNLKKTGKNYKGTCPLHKENTPSFFLRPERGLWYCFGCQKGGDIFSFLMDKENLSFGEALQLLAKRANINLSGRYDKQAAEKKEQLFRILSTVNEFYEKQLQSSTGKKAQEYIKQRGLRSEIVEVFSLGYAPDSWDATLSFLQKKGFKQEELINAGLTISRRSGRGAYDRFRNRLMFPVKDHLGRIVGFSGRLLSGEKEAKYINTPETPVFKKGKLLYGYSLADDIAQDKGYMILVEGNLDVVSMVQAGIQNVVAPLGTGLSTAQLKLLNRISNRVLIAFDQDEAGRRATKRAIIEAAREGFETKIATITGAKDPDEAVQKDRKRFIQDLKNSRPAFDFLLQEAQEEFDSNSAYGRKKLAESLFEFITQQPDNVVSDRYLEQLSAELGIRPTALQKDLQQWQLKVHAREGKETVDTVPKQAPQQGKVEKSRQEKLEDYFVALLFNLPDMVLSHPKFAQEISKLTHDAFIQPLHKKIFSIFKEHVERGSTSQLTEGMQSLEEAETQQFDTLILRDFGDVLQSEDVALAEVQRVKIDLLQRYYRRRMKKLTRQKQSNGLRDDQRQEINQKLRDITHMLRTLETTD